MQEPSVLLEQVHRQAFDSPILRLAHYVKNNKRLPNDLHNYGVAQHLSLHQARHSILRSYEEHGKANTAIACYTNANRCRINTCIQRMLFGDSIPLVDTQIVCLRNFHQHAIYNGDRGVITAIEDHSNIYKTDIEFDYGMKLKSIQTERDCFGQTNGATLFGDLTNNLLLDYGYCLTAHKLQGSQFNEVYVVKDMIKSCEDYSQWMYTALTRATTKLHFISRVGNFS
jgi:exodeoxyribonuclease-5